MCLLTAATSCGTQGTNLRGQVENGDSSEQGDSSEHTNGSGEASGVGTQELTVQILDVGQGSAALIRQGDSFLLMDGGDKDYSSYVVSYLKKEGVERLDYVIVSHYDADHLNGVVGVLNAFECKQVLSPDYKADSKVYQSYLRVIEEKNIPVEHPRLGDTYTFADSSFLICGDCTEESEQDVYSTRARRNSTVRIAAV